MESEQTCEFRDGDCALPAVRTVKSAAGKHALCANHARYVEAIEDEWDRAEAEELEQA